MLLNISAVSVVKPHLSRRTPPASACVRCQGRCSRVTVGQCQAVIITLLPLPKFRCGHLWFLCCLRDVPSFGLLFPQNPCLCISFLPLFLPQPSVSPCVSFPHCADKQPGAMAAEEVTCGVFSGVLLAMPAVSLSPRLRGVLSVVVVSLSASHLCCDWMKIILILTRSFPCCEFNWRGARVTQNLSIIMNLVLLDGERGKKNLCFFSLYSESAFYL